MVGWLFTGGITVAQYSSRQENQVWFILAQRYSVSAGLFDESLFPFQVLAAMERLDVTVKDVKATHFKTDDIGARMRALLGDASLAQHSLATEQPVGTACLVSDVVFSCPPSKE